MFKIVIVFFCLFLITFLSAEIIVKVDKISEKQLILLEQLQLDLCFEMDDYLILSVDSINDLRANNIFFTILTDDNISKPIYIISGNDKTPLKRSAYIGSIVLDEPNLRIERLSTLYKNNTMINQVKILPIKRSNRKYIFTKSVIPPSFQYDIANIGEIINSINADSIAYFMQRLEDFGSRFAYHPNRFEISEWISKQYRRFGYENVVLDKFIVEEQDLYQQNVVATLNGSKFPDRYVIIGGHYDSIIGGSSGTYDEAMLFAPGADDNASGVATTLEIARVLKLHNYESLSSIRFVNYAMEERGLIGAYHDAEKNMFNNNLDVYAMLNSDMIANALANNWIFCVVIYPEADFLTDIALKHAQNLNMNVFTTNEMNNRSDSWAYHTFGVPSLFFQEGEFSPYYHSVDDLVINTNKDYAQQMMKLIASTLLTTSNLFPAPKNFIIYNYKNTNSMLAEWERINDVNAVYNIILKDTETNEERTFSTTENNYLLQNLIQNRLYEITLFATINDINSIAVKRYIIPMFIPHIIEKIVISNHPNPFNLNTILKFTITEDDIVEIIIYNLKGQIVKKYDKNYYSRGSNMVLFETNNLSSGVYFYKVKTNRNGQRIKKMVLLK